MYCIDLPFAPNALEPVISEETVFYHYERHHKGYETKLLKLMEEQKIERHPLTEYILDSRLDIGIRNNAAQILNHNMYWMSLSPTHTLPSGKLKDKIEQKYGNIVGIKKEIKAKIETVFGSGWVWLVEDCGELSVISTSNGINPISFDLLNPLLAIDVWEHAYYIDYRDRRDFYIAALLDILNWDYASANYKG